MSSTEKEVKVEFPGLIRVFKDGSVERLFGSPHVPPTLEDPKTGVSSKDITISTEKNLLARLYLPKLTTTTTNKKLPILVYFHGGGFCLESAFSLIDHRYMNNLSSQAQVIVLSVEYRLAPEHPLPAAYEDCWTALNWVASYPTDEPWIANHADLDAIFIGGDSAGANIVHNIAMKAGQESLKCGVKILGAFLSHPYFLDEKSVPELEMAYKIWEFVYPNAAGGLDSYMINPLSGGAPSLSGIRCSRVFVVVAEKDELRDSGVRYYESVKKSGFEGIVELFEVVGEGHCFHAFNPDSDNAKVLIQRLASFLQK